MLTVHFYSENTGLRQGFVNKFLLKAFQMVHYECVILLNFQSVMEGRGNVLTDKKN